MKLYLIEIVLFSINRADPDDRKKLSYLLLPIRQ